MDNENGGGKLQAEDPKVVEVIRVAKELERLLRQRAEIMQRIQFAKQTITGLVSLFGGTLTAEDLRGWEEPRKALRQPGFTRACREVLLEGSGRPLNCREFQEQLRMKFPALAGHHKDLGASVTTVLNRLVRYGEARATEDGTGRRAWQSAAGDVASLLGGRLAGPVYPGAGAARFGSGPV